MREIKVYAPAKLNLYLDVLSKRPDRYHNIETIFEKIDLLDEIIIKEKGRGLRVRADAVDCSQGRDNIVYKAARALFKETGSSLNLDIEIRKKIPVSAGLGGGSSDAASFLRAVNEIFKLGLPGKKLFSIACGLGKDVPFFMQDAPFGIGRNTGEALEPLKLNRALFHILVKPNISLSTSMMYKRIDNLSFSSKPHSMKKMLSSLKGKGIDAIEANYYNVFENVLAGNSVYIDRAKELLAEKKAGHSLLSGSGPSVFCTFADMQTAENIFKKLPKDNRMSVFLVRTYKGGIYGDNRG